MSSLYVLYDTPELNLRARRGTPLFQLVKRVIARWQVWNNARVTTRELDRMPDYILRDLGIERSQIGDVARSMAQR